MGKPGKPVEPPAKRPGAEAPPAPAPEAGDDEYEDGDMATPKCDDHGDDDEPL